MADEAATYASGAALAEHCFYCFAVLEHELDAKHNAAPVPAFEGATDEYPLFVTWNTLSSGGGMGRRAASAPRLRGCIGTFEATELATGLAEYASIAAFKDRRFTPIVASELPRLQCAVSLLTRFEECEHCEDWEIGVHGIYIHLPNPAAAVPRDESASSSSGASTPAPAAKRRAPRWHATPAVLTATYVPDVIPAQRWSKLDAIDSAIRKAGYSGTITPALRASLRVRRYRADKAHVDYAAYVAWKARSAAPRLATP